VLSESQTLLTLPGIKAICPSSLFYESIADSPKVSSTNAFVIVIIVIVIIVIIIHHPRIRRRRLDIWGKLAENWEKEDSDELQYRMSGI